MTVVNVTPHTDREMRSHHLGSRAMLRALLVLLSAIAVYGSTICSPRAAEQDPAPSYHGSILANTPAFYDRTGSRLPFKYAAYLSQQKYLLLYFASNANAQSQKFTTELATWYLANGGGDNIEVILIGKALPADDPKTWMKDKDMPWLALAPDDASHVSLTTKYGSTLMPTLILLDENDEVVARSNDGEKNLGTRVVFKKYLELTKVPKKK
jgi:hypothetical protein